MRIGIVIQRYGEEVNGGAELHARWLAERLIDSADVTILTTCAIDYQTWADFYPAGETMINGVRVRRFPIDETRNWHKAQIATKKLLLAPRNLFDEWAWLRLQGPLSTPLLQTIEKERAQFDAFIFFTYLYATTFFGLPLVNEKAILIPTAHDDPFLEFGVYRPIFHLPHTIFYNTETERTLVERITQNQHVSQRIVGIGINVPEQIDESDFRQKYRILGEFALYIGRIDESKNVNELIDYFLRYVKEKNRPIQLVLAGKSQLDLPDHPSIRAIGFISEKDKFAALQAASVFIMPSHFESLSMVTLEAWLMGTPTLVNSQCTVLKDQTRLSHGGLYYNRYVEFEAALSCLLDSAELRHQLGVQGRRFVQSRYQWDQILAHYHIVLNEIVANSQNKKPVD